MSVLLYTVLHAWRLVVRVGSAAASEPDLRHSADHSHGCDRECRPECDAGPFPAEVVTGRGMIAASGPLVPAGS